MRKLLAVAALSLFVVANVSAADVVRRGDPRDEPPLSKIVRIVKKAVRSLGDAIVTPRP